MTFGDKTVLSILAAAILFSVIFSADFSAVQGQKDSLDKAGGKAEGIAGLFDRYNNLSRENKIAFWGIAVPITACFLAVLTGLFFPIILKMRIAKKQRRKKQ